ncbi:MAG: SoxR reducing system RseC family protein [Elusimicrobiota bacterium]|nr:SoxR reducing system RseC family protein [Elusimicrobiota bacterium]MDH5661618.1 SoxR reducing system RseC family protein [Elusimicrobiota bacterium]
MPVKIYRDAHKGLHYNNYAHKELHYLKILGCFKMEEKGKVVKVENGMAQVEMGPTSACARCGICLQSSGDKPILYVTDSKGARPGDEVIVSVDSRQILKTAFLVYLFPLVGLIAGYFLGRAILGTEIAGIIFAAFGFFATLFFLRQYDKRLKSQKSKEARIIQIFKR